MRLYFYIKKFTAGLFLALIIFGCLAHRLNEVFECDKQMQMCEYKYKTLISREFEVLKTYNLNDIVGAEFRSYEKRVKRPRRAGGSAGARTRVKVVKEVVLLTKSGEALRVPITFNKKDSAKNLADEINAYIQSDEPKYVYEYNMNPIYAIVILAWSLAGVWFFFIRKKKREVL